MEAFERVREVADMVNEKKRSHEQFSAMLDLYNRIQGAIPDLCQPHRRHVREGEMREEQKVYRFVLLNDLLIKTKEKGEWDVCFCVVLFVVGFGCWVLFPFEHGIIILKPNENCNNDHNNYHHHHYYRKTTKQIFEIKVAVIVCIVVVF